MKRFETREDSLVRRRACFDESVVWEAYLKLPGNFYARLETQLYTRPENARSVL